MANRQDTLRDDRLYNDLVRLKRHLRTCRACIAAMKGATPRDMCSEGMTYVLHAAKDYDDMIKLRRKVYDAHAHTFFACPDLRAHGRSYELTATPLMATGVQEAMF